MANANAPFGGRGGGRVSVVTGVPQLLDNMNRFMDYLKSEVIFKEAEQVATEMQEFLKTSAKWNDRTGNARAGLNAQAFADFQTSRVGTTPTSNVAAVGVVGRPAGGSYGVRVMVWGEAEENKWLEIAMGQRFAVIGPNLMVWGTILKTRLDERFRAL